jgi:tRNA1Val (adenine37-N6)-methyltransferase
MSNDYQQPDFYRFNQDSVQLVKWISTSISQADSIIDLGAGCGVIGIELARILKPKKLTLLELQKEFEPYLTHNAQKFLPQDIEHEIVINSFSNFVTDDKYDLIVCNPPYYLPGHGEVPKNKNRATARSFITDSWSILMQTISELLAVKGSGYIVLKADQRLYQMVQNEAKVARLSLKMHEIDSLMVFELLRLDKN